MKNTPESNSNLIEECYSRSIQLLKNNSESSGIIACASSEKAVGRNYASIFGRDAAICSLGMVASKDKELIQHAKKSLITLAHYQAPNGQIPKYVKPEIHETDFWYYGCIDATLWWLIAVYFYDSHVPGQALREQLRIEATRALDWLSCQEHPGLYLLQQNEASDWADIMPRSGFVLYTNALWYRVKKLYGIQTAKETRHYFNCIFLPFDHDIPDHRRARILVHYIKKVTRKSDFYLSFVNFSFCGDEIDVYGNILALLFGLTSLSKAEQMTDALLRLGVSKAYPVRVVQTPIQKNSRLWRLYMQRHLQNFPYQYHNGGIWPYTGGFLVMLLRMLGRKAGAADELRKFAEANALNNWEFNEWLHGKTHEPMGMAGQSWNAGMFLLAYQALREDIRL